MRKSNYTIVREPFAYTKSQREDEALIIRDLGPWDKFMTVTNNAENVVKELFEAGHLKPGQRLFVYDSDNVLSEFVIKDKEFYSF